MYRLCKAAAAIAAQLCLLPSSVSSQSITLPLKLKPRGGPPLPPSKDQRTRLDELGRPIFQLCKSDVKLDDTGKVVGAAVSEENLQALNPVLWAYFASLEFAGGQVLDVLVDTGSAGTGVPVARPPDWTGDFEVIHEKNAYADRIRCTDARCRGNCGRFDATEKCGPHGGYCRNIDGVDRCGFTWLYGDGSNATGILLSSPISMGGLSFNATYGGIMQATDNFFEMPRGGGIMGMAFGNYSLCTWGSSCFPPIIDELIAQNGLHNQFAICSNGRSAAMTVGRGDRRLQAGDVQYVMLQEPYRFYRVKVVDVHMNGKSLNPPSIPNPASNGRGTPPSSSTSPWPMASDATTTPTSSSSSASASSSHAAAAAVAAESSASPMTAFYTNTTTTALLNTPISPYPTTTTTTDTQLTHRHLRGHGDSSSPMASGGRRSGGGNDPSARVTGQPSPSPPNKDLHAIVDTGNSATIVPQSIYYAFRDGIAGYLDETQQRIFSHYAVYIPRDAIKQMPTVHIVLENNVTLSLSPREYLYEIPAELMPQAASSTGGESGAESAGRSSGAGGGNNATVAAEGGGVGSGGGGGGGGGETTTSNTTTGSSSQQQQAQGGAEHSTTPLPLYVLMVYARDSDDFVLGQTVLNHMYIEIDRDAKSIGFAPAAPGCALG